MFLFKNGRILHCSKVCNTNHSVPVNTPVIKKPYGNIYSIGSTNYCFIEAMVSVNAVRRAHLHNLLPGVVNVLGVILDHTGKLYFISKGNPGYNNTHEGLILAVFDLLSKDSVALDRDFDHMDMLQTLLAEGEHGGDTLELEYISSISPQLFRSLTNDHIIEDVSTILEEMKTEGRTVGLLEHILTIEMASGVRPPAEPTQLME